MIRWRSTDRVTSWAPSRSQKATNSWGTPFCRIAIGNVTKYESEMQMEYIKIYLHEREKFNFFLEQDIMPDSYRIEPSVVLRHNHATKFKIR